MRNPKRWFAALLTTVFCLTGCTSGEQAAETEPAAESEISVVAILKAKNSLHWQYVTEGLEQTAKSEHVNLQVLWPETETDGAVQVRLIQDAIQAEPDVLILAPNDSELAKPYAEKIRQAGIGLIYMDEPIQGQEEIPYVGSDNYHAGELAASAMAQALDEGVVAYIGGSQTQQVHFLRGSGFIQGIDDTELEFSGLKEVPDCSVSGGKEAMLELLEESPQVQGVFCASAMLCMGALEACQSMNRRDVVLMGMDTQSDVLSAVKNKRVYAVISQSGYDMGSRALQQAVKLAKGEEIPAENYIENTIISKQNVEDYLDAFVMEGRE
ncbi:MAG: sugar ABC transporter substrate-binding protein [Lachnospiraceae bacterium]|nr:sugar ABC transporter substrate-binding protein [Lachnospiraceae bacterium]